MDWALIGLRAAAAATVLLPPALLHGRAVADALMSVVALLFLLDCARTTNWAWTGRLWVRLAGALWAWLVVCSLLHGGTHAVVEALVAFRMLLFAAALEAWVLAGAAARRWLLASYAAMAVWIAAQCWQQLLIGKNLFGAPRWGDGALTGPFEKPRAGGTFLSVFFPAVLPPVLRRPGWTGLALLALAAATMVLIGQRMPTLLMAFGLLVAAALTPRLRRPVLLALAAAAIVLALTPVLSPPTYQKLVLHFAEQIGHFWTSNYGQLYVRALNMIGASPLTGLGFDGFREHCLDAAYIHGAAWLGVADGDVIAGVGCNIHPHNYWLEIGTDAGLPGLGLFAGIVLCWLARLYRGAAGDPVRLALFVGATVMLWPLASTSSLFVADTGGWIVLTVGWGLAAARTEQARASF
jgi:O-antigen ligase